MMKTYFVCILLSYLILQSIAQFTVINQVTILA